MQIEAPAKSPQIDLGDVGSWCGAMTTMPDLTIAILADTHELHRQVEVPFADILIHAGDFTMMSRSSSAIRDFDLWLGELPHRHKVVCPGNHDIYLEALDERRNVKNATLLINQGIAIMGLKIWGSPATPLEGVAFGVSSAADRAELYSKIPEHTDVVITHGPPFGILDRAPGSDHHSGCRQLLAAVQRIRPRLHVFGHAHGAYGIYDNAKTMFVNAALLGRDGDLQNLPVLLKLPAG